MNIRIATRPSKLAIKQAEMAASAIKKHYPEVNISIKEFSTRADINNSAPIESFGGKGIFVKELEQALLDKEADIAVHSTKDMPCKLNSAFVLPAFLSRASVNDVLISKVKLTLLKPGAKIGTSSLRRKLQLMAIRPDLEYKPIRGNIDTRIKKLESGYDAIILALAGLERLETETQITEIFNTDAILPAAGQGAIGIECLSSNIEIVEILQNINDHKTSICVSAERSLMAELGGHCQAPIAAYARIEKNKLILEAKVFGLKAKENLYHKISGEPKDSFEIGKSLADYLNNKGAQSLISSHGGNI
jgi:hydroxymethylbilane synthase